MGMAYIYSNLFSGCERGDAVVRPPIQIEHIGIAVRHLDSSVNFFVEKLGLVCTGYETVESEQVRTAFLQIGETHLELLEATRSDSPIAKFISKHGEGIHHLALRVDNLAEYMAELRAKDVQLINEVPKQGANNCLIAFLHPHNTNGVLLELCERLETVENRQDVEEQL